MSVWIRLHGQGGFVRARFFLIGVGGGPPGAVRLRRVFADDLSWGPPPLPLPHPPPFLKMSVYSSRLWPAFRRPIFFSWPEARGKFLKVPIFLLEYGFTGFYRLPIPLCADRVSALRVAAAGMILMAAGGPPEVGVEG